MRLPAAPVGASRLAVPPDEVPARFGELLMGLVRERRYGGTVAADGTADEEEHGETAATDAQRNLRLRHSVLRRLFDDPVLYRVGPRRRRAGVRHLPDRTPDPAPLGRAGRVPPGGTRRGLPARRPGRAWPPTSASPTTRPPPGSPRCSSSNHCAPRPPECFPSNSPRPARICCAASRAGPRPISPRTARPG